MNRDMIKFRSQFGVYTNHIDFLRMGVKIKNPGFHESDKAIIKAFCLSQVDEDNKESSGGGLFQNTKVDSVLSESDKAITNNACILWTDWHHKNKSPVVVFPQCQELLTSLWKSKFDITEECLTFPHKTFVVAMPKGFEIDGFKIPSFLVEFEDYKTVQQSFEEFSRYLDFPSVIVEGSHIIREGVTIKYWNWGMDYMYSRIPFTQFSTLLSDFEKHLSFCEKQTLETCVQFGDYNSYLHLKASNFFEEKVKKDGIMYRLLACLMIYYQTFPEKLVDGNIPCDHERRIVYTLKTLEPAEASENNPSDVIGRDSCKPHYRSWSFHTLRHERYKRDENGKPKTVFVKGCWVNTKQESKTLVH